MNTTVTTSLDELERGAERAPGGHVPDPHPRGARVRPAVRGRTRGACLHLKVGLASGEARLVSVTAENGARCAD